MKKDELTEQKERGKKKLNKINKYLLMASVPLLVFIPIVKSRESRILKQTIEVC